MLGRLFVGGAHHGFRQPQRLLMSTRWPLAEVAARCGFSTPQYLVKSFTGKFKCPPAAWRARHCEP